MIQIRHVRPLVLVVWCIALVPQELLSLGERQSVRGVGMGRTYAAVSFGLDAAGLNPANLALDDKHWLNISVAPTGFHAGGDVFSYDVYTRFFSGTESPNGLEGRYLQDVEKNMILERFEGQSTAESFADFDARLLGISVKLPAAGVLAFTITDYAGAFLEFPEDLARFMLYGNPLGSSYDFHGTDLSAEWIRAYGLSFGSKIPGGSAIDWFAFGGGVKFIHGYGYYEILRSESRLETSVYGVLTGEADFLARVSESPTLKATGFDFFPDPAGTGLGFDAGISVGLTSAISVGVSVTDIGSVTWTAHTEEIYSDTVLVIDNPLDPVQQKAILDAVSGIGRREIAGFTTQLPTKLRAGFAVDVDEIPVFKEMVGEMVFGFDYRQPIHEGPGSLSTPRYSFGLEYAPVTWLPLRTGVSTGGAGGTFVAAGFGIHPGPIALDVATDNLGWIFAPSKTLYGSISFGASLRL